jgi:hypothetical protein
LTGRALVLASTLGAAMALAACEEEVSIGDKTVSSSEVESKATEALTAKVGQAPASIDCPNDLDAKAGESETCTLTAKDGTKYEMTATIKSVDGDTANFDFQVADQAEK